MAGLLEDISIETYPLKEFKESWIFSFSGRIRPGPLPLLIVEGKGE